MARATEQPRSSPPDDGGARKYRAFISYSHKDKKWGDWLHGALETYRVPRGVAGDRRRIHPVFRDDEEVAASADLGKVITEALEDSAALVVICSPRSAASKWVDQEILDFKKLGRQDRILAIIVDGKPNDPKNECFPRNLVRRVDSDGELTDEVTEPLAVDVRSHGKRDTLLKVAAGLLGIGFDALKRRERTRTLWRIALTGGVTLAILSAYAASLLFQARAVNRQQSAILGAVARESADRGEHDRALRMAVLATRTGPLSPAAEAAEPYLVRAIHYSTVEAHLGGHEAAVYSVAFDSTGERLLTGSQDRTTRLWRSEGDAGWLQKEPVIETGHVAGARFAEHGEAIVTRSFGSGSITIWRESEGVWKPSEAFETAAGAMVRSFDMTPGGDLAVVGLQEGRLTLWRFEQAGWKIEAELGRAGEIPTSAALSSGGERLAVGFFGGALVIWKRTAPGSWQPEPGEPSDSQIEPNELAFAPSGRRLLVSRLGDLRVLDYNAVTGWAKSGSLEAERMANRGQFDPLDDRFLITNGSRVVGILWFEESPGRWVSVVRFEADEDSTRSISFAPGASRFATGGNDGLVRIWGPGELGSWGSYAKVRRNIGLIKNVEAWTSGHPRFGAPSAESSDGRRVARGNVYGVVRITDQPTGIEVAGYDASESPQYSLEFSDDDRGLRVIDTETSAELRQLDVEHAVALRGLDLIEALCRYRLRPPLSIVTAADVEAVPLIRARLGADVCENPSLASRIELAFSWLWPEPAANRVEE